ncbi:hypothetical protein E2C01_091333 [Portunus trituberculatus]|uniref:Uncharacterized protein n=1 Tax=Portunus trituberculatus TaxID=210409 RepID=A0A5B7JNA5_PORTR|nr:hypothetical protein [Portunus trituberculatus]
MWVDRQTGRQIDRQKDRQLKSETGSRKTDTQRDRKTEKKRHSALRPRAVSHAAAASKCISAFIALQIKSRHCLLPYPDILRDILSLLSYCSH